MSTPPSGEAGDFLAPNYSAPGPTYFMQGPGARCFFYNQYH